MYINIARVLSVVYVILNGCMVYLPCNVDCMPKSPVELQRLPRPGCMDIGRGDGDGAGDTELLLGESECSEPFDWWINFVRLKHKVGLVECCFVWLGCLVGV